MGTGHKPGSGCEVIHAVFSKFRAPEAGYFRLLAGDSTVDVTELKKLDSGCAIFRRLGFDWACSCWSHDLTIQLVDHATGDPLSNRAYRLHLGDHTVEGRTNRFGYTELIQDDGASLVRIEVLPEDLLGAASPDIEAGT